MFVSLTYSALIWLAIAGTPAERVRAAGLAVAVAGAVAWAATALYRRTLSWDGDTLGYGRRRVTVADVHTLRLEREVWPGHLGDDTYVRLTAGPRRRDSLAVNYHAYDLTAIPAAFAAIPDDAWGSGLRRWHYTLRDRGPVEPSRASCWFRRFGYLAATGCVAVGAVVVWLAA